MALAGVCRGTARGLLSAAAEPALAVGCLQLVRGLATGTGAAAAAAAGEGEQPTHVFDDGGDIVGTYTPVTKRLWQQRYKWTDDKLAAAAPRDPAAQLVKPPKLTTVVYPFSSDEVLREHVRAGLRGFVSHGGMLQGSAASPLAGGKHHKTLP